MESIKIIECQLQHLEALENLCKTTFRQTYEKFNQADNFARYMEEAFSQQQLKVELGNSASQFFLAQRGKEFIGYLKTNLAPAQTDVQDPKSLEIERIYVLKDYQGKNIGKLLADQAMEVARQRNLEYIWLGVWEKNPKAIRFYEKQGYKKFGTHTFLLGNDPQMDYLMKLMIT